ncbi:MAG: DEAD/DEAH box helicase family protein [Candidatus Methanomethylophilaceae archaeon]|nr:DEAD/DEAH box helicase family protein [Candidatus Methanomethylophilaceae archaeon]
MFPTGFGKTVIVLKVAVEFLGEREITILVPTEPLVNQRSRFFSEMLSGTARLPCAS